MPRVTAKPRVRVLKTTQPRDPMTVQLQESFQVVHTSGRT